jgi:hypothetical protein
LFCSLPPSPLTTKSFVSMVIPISKKRAFKNVFSLKRGRVYKPNKRASVKVASEPEGSRNSRRWLPGSMSRSS